MTTEQRFIELIFRGYPTDEEIEMLNKRCDEIFNESEKNPHYFPSQEVEDAFFLTFNTKEETK